MEPQNSESDTHLTTTTPTFPKKTDQAPHNPHMGVADGLRRSHRRRRRDRTSTTTTTKRTKAKIVKEETLKKEEKKEEEEEEEEEDREEIERKIEALQRIVPGGESLGIEKLFDETAGYIMALQCQLKGLRVLTNFFESLEKEKKSKLGG